MTRKKTKNNRLKHHTCFYEAGGANILCKGNNTHETSYISYIFKTKGTGNTTISRLIQKCKNCKKMIIDRDKYSDIKNRCSGVGDYAFIDNMIKIKPKKTTIQKPEVKKTRNIYRVNAVNDVYNHQCCGKPVVVKEQISLKKSSFSGIIYKCKTCNNRFCYRYDIEGLQVFNKYLKIVDLELTQKHKEVDKYIRNNMDQFMVKEGYISSIESSTPNLTADDYFRILKKIKRQNKYDFVIKGNTYYCSNSQHKIIEINASLDIIKKDGKIENISCPAYYCDDCETFYIHSATYDKIRERGVPLCKVYDMYKFTLGDNNYYDLNSESIIHSFGYNVNGNDNLTMLQRQIILKNIIDNHILSKQSILTHLNFLRNRSLNKKIFAQACRRWKEDIDFVNEYNSTDSVGVDINSLKKIHYVIKTN